MINCGNGSMNLFGRVIHDHSRYASLIDGGRAGAIEQYRRDQHRIEVGEEHLYEYVRKFGFGKKTGLPLPGESGGMVRPLAGIGERLDRFGCDGPRNRRYGAAIGAGRARWSRAADSC